MSNNRRILVIAYVFPPLGGGGVQRILKFVKFLPYFGYESIVLTTSDHKYDSIDESLLADVPSSTPVIRVSESSFLRSMATAVRHLRISASAPLLGWPDRFAPWILPATREGIRAVRKFRPDVILSTSAPYSNHLVAFCIAKATGVPWVADFRDEWAHNEFLPTSTWLGHRARVAAERLIIKNAQRTVRAADSIVLEAVPGYDQRVVTILNGVDEDDFGWDPHPPSFDRFTLVHVGTLYGERDCSPIIEAVRRLVSQGIMDAADVEIRIVGNAVVGHDAKTHGIVITETGYVNHAEAISEMRRASVLLLHAPAWTLAPTGKIFEYLASARPIICVCNRNNLAYRLVRTHDAGFSVEPGNLSGIERALTSLYQEWKMRTLKSRSSARSFVLTSFSRRKFTGELARILDLAAGTSSTYAQRRDRRRLKRRVGLVWRPRGRGSDRLG